MLTRDDNHVYRWNGAVVPGVTSIMGALRDFAGIPEWVLDYASERGGAVHKATVLVDKNQLDEPSLDPEIVPYVDAWRLFTQREKPEWACIEQMLYDPVNRYAGEPDRAGWVLDGWNVVEIKATAELHPAFGVQLAGYRRLCAIDADFDERATGRLVVHLMRNGKYKVERYADRLDEIAFGACLAIYNWRMKWMH